MRFLTPAERTRLLAIARVSECTKLYLFIVLALTTGAPRGELLGLRHCDLDLAAGTAMLHTTKNGRPRVLPLTQTVIDEITRLGKPAAPSSLLFCGPYRSDKPMHFTTAWLTALRLARIEDFKVHDLRHSAASYCAQAGASLLEIADLLGHQSLDVTRRYSHLTVENKRAGRPRAGRHRRRRMSVHEVGQPQWRGGVPLTAEQRRLLLAIPQVTPRLLAYCYQLFEPKGPEVPTSTSGRAETLAPNIYLSWLRSPAHADTDVISGSPTAGILAPMCTKADVVQ